MIGSYLDKQVTNVKNGVLAAGSLLGIGLIIYFIVKKRGAIAAGLGIGKSSKKNPTTVDIDKPKMIGHDTDESTDHEDEVVDIDIEEEEDVTVEEESTSENTDTKEE